MLADLRNWLAVLVAVLIGVGGLFYAAKGEVPGAYTLGLGVFAVAVVVVIITIRRALDEAEQ